MFDINIELRDGEPEVYKKKFFVDTNAEEKEIAKEFVLSLEKVKKIEYGKDFLYLRVNKVICKTTIVEEILKDEILTKLIKNGDKKNG